MRGKYPGLAVVAAAVYYAGVPWIRPVVAAPWWTMAYTSPWTAEGPSVPPHTFTAADVRVVASLTTTPAHLEHIRPTLNSLLAQTFRLDAIYLGLPKVFARSGSPYVRPAWLDDYEARAPAPETVTTSHLRATASHPTSALSRRLTASYAGRLTPT